MAPSLFTQAEQWFTRSHAALLNELPCRKGCCRCCIGPFPITLLDIEELRRGLSTLRPVKRQAIEDRARRQVRLAETAYPRLMHNPFLDEWTDAELDQLVTRFEDLPCPALQADGSCGLYEFRPLICRTMGIPTESRGTVEGACEIQTAVPIRRLPKSLRQEEDRLAEMEAVALAQRRAEQQAGGEELLLPYGMLCDQGHR